VGAQVDALESEDPLAPALGEDGRLIVRFTEQVVRDASPDEDTFSEMARRFTNAEIVQLVLVIGQYMMVGRVMATARIEPDEALGAEVLAGAERAQQARASGASPPPGAG
jgi:alkylhydroperoxidase family enzyme